MKNAKISFGLFLLMAFLTLSCRKEYPLKDSEPEVNPNVKVASNEVNEKIQYVSETADTIKFNGSVSDFQPGDIIVSEKDEGILRKVSFVIDQDGNTELITLPVSIAEAFPNSDFSCNLDLTPSNIDEIKYNLKGIALTKGLDDNGLNFNINDIVLWDKDNNLSTTNDQVTADGSLVLQLNPYLKWKNLKSEARTVIVGCDPTGIIQLSVNCPLKIDLIEPDPVLLMTIKTKPQTLFIAGVPVIITTEIPIYVGLKGKAELKLSAGIKNTTTLHAELKWEDGTYSFEKSINNNFELILPSISAGVELQAYVKPDLNIRLYGVAGPTIDVKGFVRAEGSVEGGMTGGTLSAAIYGGVELTIGLILKVFDFRLTSVESPPIISFEKKIKEWVSVIDIDGNEYNTIELGSQRWMKENLKTKRYNTGEIINETSPPTADISGETMPEYQWAYAGDETNVSTYGRVYTWFALNSNRGICPLGWHVPTDDDWEKLAKYISNDNGGYGKLDDDWYYVGGKLKSETGWNNTGNGTDNYNFTALPAGGRAIDGTFVNLGDQTIWWSQTEYPGNSLNSYVRIIANTSSSFLRHNYDKRSGFSIRCLKN